MIKIASKSVAMAHNVLTFRRVESVFFFCLFTTDKFSHQSVNCTTIAKRAIPPTGVLRLNADLEEV